MARLVAIVRWFGKSRIARFAVFIGGGILGLVMLIVTVTQFPGTTDAVATLDRGSTSRLPGLGRAAGKQQRLDVRSLEALRSTVFIHPATGEATVWYEITLEGTVELFTAGGLHPVSGRVLKPVTPEVVQLLERRMITVEQQRLAESERRAATARADAEIAKARLQLKSRPLGPIAAGAAQPRTELTSPPTSGAAPSRTESEPERLPTGSSAARSTTESEPERLPTGSSAAPSTTESEPERLPTGASAAPSAGMKAPPDPGREIRYNELLGSARALLDAGRFEEARTSAQRAIHVDPSRMAARSLWAEAQTMMDARGNRGVEFRR